MGRYSKNDDVLYLSLIKKQYTTHHKLWGTQSLEYLRLDSACSFHLNTGSVPHDHRSGPKNRDTHLQPRAMCLLQYILVVFHNLAIYHNLECNQHTKSSKNVPLYPPPEAGCWQVNGSSPRCCGIWSHHVEVPNCGCLDPVAPGSNSPSEWPHRSPKHLHRKHQQKFIAQIS